jgi:hypothetical protein
LIGLSSYGNFEKNLKIETSGQEAEEEPDYLRVKEIFSFENFARMHREIEQLKDVVRDMRSHTIPELKRENAEFKKIAREHY